MNAAKSFFGWLGIAIDVLCLGVVGLCLITFYQPNGGDAMLILVVAAPFLAMVMLVATSISVACFVSLRNSKRSVIEHSRQRADIQL